MKEFKGLSDDQEFDADELELLDYLLAEEGVVAAARAQTIKPRAPGADAPLSYAQQRLWFLDQLQPGNPAYNMPGSLRLTGRLDVSALEATLNEVLRRHEVLRTTFPAVAGQPVQRVAPHERAPLPSLDLMSLARERQAAEVRRIAATEARQPFDLATGPLLRARLLRLAADEHVLLVTMHHIVSDGWSVALLISELATLYAAFAQGRPSPLSDLPVQYADYAIWQRDWLTGEVLDEQLSYWRGQLGGDLPVLQMPADKPRPAVASLRGATQSVALDREASERLKALAQAEGATLFMALLAAFQILLARYTGQTDIPVGTPVANRHPAEVEGLIGFFVNTLVMRGDLSGRPSFREVLRRVRATALGAYAHQDVPFEMLVEELQPERDRSRTPLFQVSLALQAAPLPEPETQGVRWRAEEMTGGGAKFDLTLELEDMPTGLAGVLEYNTDIFEAETARRLAAHFRQLVGGLVAAPDRPVSELPLLTEEETRRLLVEWNATAADYPRDLCLHELFERQVAAAPEAVAVIFEDERLTYAELNERANQLARHLRELGGGPEARVGVLMERSVELVVGLLAIMKAGAAYVPLDPDYPQERLAFMLADAGVRVLLTQERLRGRVPTGAETVVCLDSERATFAAYGTENLNVGVTADSMIYVIYTSGSTGRPKGVMLPHRGIVNCLLWMQSAFRLGPHDRTMLKASLSFDASVWELFWPLLVGAGVVVARPGGQQDSAYLVRAAERDGVTILHFVPSMLSVFLNEQELGRAGSVRRVLAGGEALPPDTMARFHARMSAELHNFYGPTETSIGSLDWRCEPGGTYTVVPIGRPIANTQIYILDRDGRPVPVGVPGELYVGGDGLARGYLGRPELTAERFVPDPFARTTGARLYRTGDLARYLADGNVEFLGRVDYQVKIRGFRIELEEIEAVLGRHAAVRESVVVAREVAAGDKRLVAYVVAAGSEPPTVGELRRHLKGQLPDYMVPAAFVMLDELPLAPSGKVDRKALPAPDDAGREFAASYVAPRTPVEEVLAGVLAEVLGVVRVGVHDNFFALGGHSLLATQVVSRVREILRVELPLSRFFEAPVVAELAAAVEPEMRAGRAASAPPLSPVPRDGALPLSFAQQRLWFIDQLEPGNPVYNMPGAVRLEGRLDKLALERALNEVVRRHEALRTTFVSGEGRPAQVVAPSLSLPLPVVDLTRFSAAEGEAEAQHLATAEVQLPFDLAAGPLLRARLLQLSADDHVLLVTMHHIVSDGWSVGVLVREAAALYAAYAEGHAASLPELPVQYADYSVWQRDWLRGEALDEQLAYWRRQLAGAPPLLELPTDRPRPKAQTYRGAALAVELPQDLTEDLKSLGRREGVTLFMTLLAAFQVLLARYTGQTDIPVGSPVANRRRREVENLVGFFVNTLVLRTDLSGDPAFTDLLARVREVCLGAYAHQDVPFEMLVEELQPERDLSYTPLFQALLVLQNAPGGEFNLPGLKLTPMLPQSGTAKFDLMLSLTETDAGLEGVFEYNADLFDEATARRLLGHFETLLRAASTDARRRLSSLPLLRADEERRLLVDWNDTAAEFPRESCVHELVERQAAHTPAAAAVVFDGERLSYGELNERANRLAHFLRAQGVGPEVVVGVLMERSVEMMVGVLGILKAGGAYLPLDPENPRERLSFMLADAGARALLTHERLAERVPQTSARVVRLDADWAEVARARGENPARLATPDNAAYVIYTSGSTGKPKAVAMPHRAAVNLVTFQRRSSGETAGARTLQFAPLSFDVSFQEIFSTWCAGGALILLDEDARRDPRQLLDVLAGQEVGRLFLPFVALQQLAEAAAEGGRAPRSLRAVITAGEQLKITPQVERLFGLLAGCVLDNHYGPTETHLATMWRLAGDARRWPALPPIGRPIANARVFLLDARMTPVPVGVPGELYVGGDGLARGYLGRPELTAERFVPDPFSAEAGARLYRTGDLARYLTDGRLEYAGRADLQVKVRGFRVEVGEIEAVLKQHSAVTQAAVVAREDAPGVKRLVAYVVLAEPSRPPVAGELRSFLKERLPEYMIPAVFVLLDALPLTPSGKVDRQRLPAPDEAARTALDVHVAPRTPVEEVLCSVWAEVLKVGRVGVHDNFFELGGHSLLATQLMSRVRQAFGTDVALRQLFEQPTVAELARAVEAKLRAGESTSAPPLRPAPRAGALPLSFAQQRLWFLDRLDPGGASYNLPTAVRVRGPLDAGALEQSLAEIVRRHEVLRTTFTAEGGRPVQVIAPAARPDFSVTDLSGLPAPERAAEAARLARAEAQRPFDLAAGPLMRTRLLRLSGAEHLLLLTMHHIVSDGWSMGILIREVSVLYEAFSRGAASPLTALPVQYADYALWQREWLTGEKLAEQLAYWRGQLAGAPPVLELPTDFPRPAVKTFNGATLAFTLPRELNEKLQALSRREGATLFMTLLSAFNVLLARYTEQTEILIGTPVANRTRTEIESLIGFFVNTLVIRTDLTGEPSFRELLRRVRAASLQAYAHQDVPFEKLVEELQPERNLSYSPLFQVAFALQNAPMPDVALSGLQLSVAESAKETAKFDLALAIEETPDGLAGELEYNTDLFRADTMRRMIGHFQTILEGVVANPDERCAALPLLTPAERRQLLFEFNDTAGAFPQDVCVHELFEARAGEQPEAVACVFAGGQLTYGELNARANRLAHQLMTLGVGPEVRVGVLTERSPEMIVGVLGVVKAGGAYVPLDPAWPAARLQWILSSLNITCLLTQSALQRTVHDLQWQLPRLQDVVYLDVQQPRPPAEPLNEDMVRSLWDHVAERAVDEVTAGGFISSYTGEPFAAREVEEYRERIVSLARGSLGQGGRVLEIGCGSGLIMFALAPQTQKYIGLDSSPLTQEQNRARVRRRGLDQVELRTGFADEIDKLPAESFDLVIMASTAQFFPGPGYFMAVLAKALRLLVKGGTVLLGDVMDARRKEEFLESLLAFQRRHPDAQTKTQLGGELYFDEDFFHDAAAELADVADVQVLHRAEGFKNELGYRYDVVLKKGVAAEKRERKKNLLTAWQQRHLPASNPASAVTAENVAYNIFTSGSTGTPKGVVVRHRSVINLIDWVNQTFAVGPRDRLLFVTSLNFDLSVYDIFGTLAAGASFYIAARADLRDPRRLARLLTEQPITFWDSAPVALQQPAPFFDAGAGRDARSHLRLVFLSGDWIPLSLPDQVRQAFPGAQVVSLGGATEATVWSNFFPVESVAPHWASIPYGRPIRNARYYILDARLNPVPVGVPGDLYIGGCCLALGYTDAALTAARFIPDPFGEAGERLYQTGDRARFMADGNIEFLGRLDQQVKIRGFRIELGEIETALARHEAVREAVAAVKTSAAGERRLVGYVVPRREPPPTTTELRAYLGERLPEYMIPSAFVLLERLPLTPNGKLDRQALPESDTSRPTLAASYLAPTNELERQIAQVWQDVLQLEQVGVNDNFFELGGHSLLVAQAHSRLVETLKRELPVVALFKYPTVAALAQAIGSAGPEAAAATSHGRRGRDRLAALQERMRTR